MTAASAQPALPAKPNVQLAPVAAFSPEFDLLLACCRLTCFGPPRTGLARTGKNDSSRVTEILARPLNWSWLLELAEHHGVLAQLQHALAVPCAARLEFTAIRQRYEGSARQALWLSRELLRIVDHLASLGIQTLPHKGPVLAEMLYGSVAARQFSDLDLIVHIEDVSRIKIALSGLGYQPGMELTPREQRAYLASGYEYAFNSPRGRNLLEIQWQVLPRFYSIAFDVSGFFDREQTVNVAGQSLKTLSAEDTFLVLCVHAAKHAWAQLSWLSDIATMIRTAGINWKVVESESKRLGIERIVAVTFFLIAGLLEKDPPWNFPYDAETQDLGKTILPILARGEDYNPESIPYFRMMMRLRESRKDQARFLWRLVSTPGVGEWSAVRLPAPLSPLYRAVRIFRLMRRL